MDTQTFIDTLIAKLDGAYAASSLTALRSDFRQYTKWCELSGVDVFPIDADKLATYVDEMSCELKPATIRRRIDSLGTICFHAGLKSENRSSPVKLALKRMHRKLGRRQEQAYPLTRDHLQKMLSKCPKSTVIGLRNRVLLTLGYETMRRRSEIAAFQFEDLRVLPEGKFALLLRRSKTDQLGDGRLIPISEELANLIKRWAKKIGFSTGPILRSVNRGENVGKNLCAAAIPAILVDLQYRARLRHLPDFSGHSFRVGAAVDMLRDGVSLEEIMLRGGWTQESTALRYLQSWAANADPLEIAIADDAMGKPAF